MSKEQRAEGGEPKPREVAALFVRHDSVYKLMPGVDAWDAERDAMSYQGTAPVVAHPPCRRFGQLRHMAKGSDEEKRLAYFAIERARVLGGVVEHPAHSKLWAEMGLGGPGLEPDEFGGITVAVNQFAFGHKALKPTWLYIVRCSDLPTLPVEYGKPTHCIVRCPKRMHLKHVTKPEREHTPPAFAAWLVEVARRSAPLRS